MYSSIALYEIVGTCSSTQKRPTDVHVHIYIIIAKTLALTNTRNGNRTAVSEFILGKKISSLLVYKNNHAIKTSINAYKHNTSYDNTIWTMVVGNDRRFYLSLLLFLFTVHRHHDVSLRGLTLALGVRVGGCSWVGPLLVLPLRAHNPSGMRVGGR